jgi:hypothetical protein
MSPRVIQPSLTQDATGDLQSLATRLSNYLFHENNEVVLEAARALGSSRIPIDITWNHFG